MTSRNRASVFDMITPIRKAQLKLDASLDDPHAATNDDRDQ